MKQINLLNEFAGGDYPLPFSFGKYSYATDGAIIVRVEHLKSASHTIPQSMKKTITSLFRKKWAGNAYVSLSDVPFDGQVRFHIGGQAYDRTYIRKIIAICGPKVKLQSGTSSKIEDPRKFTFPKGVGLIMAMKIEVSQ